MVNPLQTLGREILDEACKVILYWSGEPKTSARPPMCLDDAVRVLMRWESLVGEVEGLELDSSIDIDGARKALGLSAGPKK